MSSPLIPITQTVTPFPALDATDWYAWATDVDTWTRATASGAVSGVGLAPNVQVANYTLALLDEMALVSVNSSSPLTVTVPPHSAVAFPQGSRVFVGQAGTGQVTVTAGAGVTLRLGAGKQATTRGQFSIIELRQAATDTWYLDRDLTRTDIDPAAQAYVDASVTGTPVIIVYTGTAWPVRPNTSSTGRPVLWIGPGATPVPSGGTTAGGTAKYAPGDLFWYS